MCQPLSLTCVGARSLSNTLISSRTARNFVPNSGVFYFYYFTFSWLLPVQAREEIARDSNVRFQCLPDQVSSNTEQTKYLSKADTRRLLAECIIHGKVEECCTNNVHTHRQEESGRENFPALENEWINENARMSNTEYLQGCILRDIAYDVYRRTRGGCVRKGM